MNTVSWSIPPSHQPEAEGSAAGQTSAPRKHGVRDVASESFDVVRKACATYRAACLDPSRAAPDLDRERVERDLRIGIALGSLPEIARREITAAVTRFDTHVTAATELARAEAPRDVVGGLIDSAYQLLDDGVSDLSQRLTYWRRATFLAVCGGLATILVGVGLAWLAPSAQESVGGLGLAAVGAVVAVAMTQFRTNLGTTPPALRGLLAMFPLVVLAAVIALQYLRRPPATAPGSIVVVTVVALALLAAPIVVVALSRSGAATDVAPALASVVHVRGSDLGHELDVLQRKIREEGRRQAGSARRWQVAFLMIGGAAALTSGSAAVTALNAADSPWVVVLALLGGVAGGLVTALNPGSRWSDAKALAVTCDSLADEVGMLLRLDLGTLTAETLGRQQLEKIAVRFDAIRGVPARARLWPFTPH